MLTQMLYNLHILYNSVAKPYARIFKNFKIKISLKIFKTLFSCKGNNFLAILALWLVQFLQVYNNHLNLGSSALIKDICYSDQRWGAIKKVEVNLF